MAKTNEEREQIIEDLKHSAWKTIPVVRDPKTGVIIARPEPNPGEALQRRWDATTPGTTARDDLNSVLDTMIAFKEKAKEDAESIVSWKETHSE